MDYVNRIYDPVKVKITERGIYAYVNRLCDLPKKNFFDGLHKHFGGHFIILCWALDSYHTYNSDERGDIFVCQGCHEQWC